MYDVFDKDGIKLFGFGKNVDSLLSRQSSSSLLKDLVGSVWDNCAQYFGKKSDALVDFDVFSKAYRDLDTVDEETLRNTNDCMIRSVYLKYAPSHLELLTRPTKKYLEYFMANTPLNLRFLIGCPGVGKSSFIRYISGLRLNEINHKNNKQYMTIVLDLSSTEVSHFESDLLAELNERIRTSTIDIDPAMDVYSKMIELGRIFNLIIVFDNIDTKNFPEREVELMTRIFDVNNKAKERLSIVPAGCNIWIITVMRRLTFLKMNLTNIFVLHDLPPVDILPSPPIDVVFRDRIEFIKNEKRTEVLDGISRIKKKIEFDGKRISVDLSPAEQFDLLCKLFLFIDERASTYLTNATLGNVRAMIQIYVDHLLSAKFNNTAIGYYIVSCFALKKRGQFSELLRIENSPKIQRHDIIFTVYNHNEELRTKTDFICLENMYNCNSAHDNGLGLFYLVKTRCLEAVEYLMGEQEPNRIRISDVVSTLANVGYHRNMVVDALKSLIKNRVLITSTLDDKYINDQSEDFVFLGMIGQNQKRDEVFYDFGYIEANVANLKSGVEREGDYIRPYIFPHVANAVKYIAAAEQAEVESLQADTDKLDLLNKITEGRKLWQRLEASHTETLKRISNKNVVERKMDFVKKVEDAETIYDSIGEYIANIRVNKRKPVNVFSLVNKIIASARERSNGLHDVHDQAFTGPYWRIEPIKRLNREGLERCGGEIFFQVDGIRAGSMFSSIPPAYGSTAVALDKVALRTVLHEVDNIRAMKKLEFLSLNMCPQFHDACNSEESEELKDILMKFKRRSWLVLELPDSFFSKRTLQCIYGMLGGMKQIAVDDALGFNSSALSMILDDEFKNLRYLKLDWKYFQFAFNNDRENLTTI